MSFREFTFCNADQIEVMIDIDIKSGRIIDMYCYADRQPNFENPETGREYKTAILRNRLNPLFVTIKNNTTTLKRMVAYGDYLPLLDTEDSEYESDFATLVKCFEKYKIKPHENTLSY